jgi:hypothetical protein
MQTIGTNTRFAHSSNGVVLSNTVWTEATNAPYTSFTSYSIENYANHTLNASTAFNFNLIQTNGNSGNITLTGTGVNWTGVYNGVNLTPTFNVASGVTWSGGYRMFRAYPTHTNLGASAPTNFFLDFGITATGAGFQVTSDNNVRVYKTLSAPTGTTPTNAFVMYAEDITAGNSAPHFKTENADIIKLYKQTTGVSAGAYASVGGSAVSSNDTFGGYSIGQIVDALKNLGLL